MCPDAVSFSHFSSLLLSSSQEKRKRKCMEKRADHLGRSLVTAFPLSLLSSWDATRCPSHTQTLAHTLTQDRRYRARFSYKYPMGECQTPPVVWRSPPLFPHPLLLSPPLSPPLVILYFLLVFIYLFYGPSNLLLFVISFLFYVSSNVSFMRDKLCML